MLHWLQKKIPLPHSDRTRTVINHQEVFPCEGIAESYICENLIYFFVLLELKMSDSHLNGTKSNGTSATEVKTPFLIGVAGGTASGKVNLFIVKVEKMCSPYQSSYTRHFTVTSQFSRTKKLTNCFPLSRPFAKGSWNNSVRLIWIMHRDK